MSEPGAPFVDGAGSAERWARALCISLQVVLLGGRRWRRIAIAGGLALVPIRIGQRDLAGGIQLADLFGSEIPARGTQILPELLFVASADNDRSDGRALQEPVERYLRNRFAGFVGDFVECIHHAEDVLIGNRRTCISCFREPADIGRWLIP